MKSVKKEKGFYFIIGCGNLGANLALALSGQGEEIGRASCRERV